MRHPRGHGLRMFLGLLGLLALFGLAVMLLWNAILPGLVPVGQLDYPRAVGLLALCRLLFGGLGPGLRGRGLREHFHNMNPEQREALRRHLHEHFPAASRGRPGWEESRGSQAKPGEAGEKSSPESA